MRPRLSSDSGGTIKIRRPTPREHGLVSTWLGLAARISPAETRRLYSSTWPLRWTTRTTSSAPHGRTQAKQHRRLFPILTSSLPPSSCGHGLYKRSTRMPSRFRSQPYMLPQGRADSQPSLAGLSHSLYSNPSSSRAASLDFPTFLSIRMLIQHSTTLASCLL
ncbi:unnamed protein product [Musa acuminata subsp. burmannicoides]